MAENNGGPAFPKPGNSLAGNPKEWVAQDGMALRDWFAGQALTGIMVQYPIDPPLTTFQGSAALAYLMADAMLKAREKSNES